jgi:D-alanyl-D-alanine dipeptidase
MGSFNAKKVMKTVQICALIGLLIITNGCSKMDNKLPEDFVVLSEIDPTIIENIRYYGDQNFLGRPVAGYKVNKVVCTKQAAEQLKKANDAFKKQGYKIVVYDGYRPQRAVDDFKKWGEDIKDDVAKSYYYPTYAKQDLFKLRYIAGERSTHTRGSTFDVTIIKAEHHVKPIVFSKRTLNNGEEISFLDDNTVDMGSSFDLFHVVSRPDSKLVNENHYKMRKLLRDVMAEYGFKVYDEEWWHFSLENEPYPDTYFDFMVER